jgi:putative photosynthetic complex assembly protein 2
MVTWLVPVAFAAFAWWASTGIVLVLVRRPPLAMPTTMAFASVLAVAALFLLTESARGTGAADAYVAFVCALAVWGWHELAFLCGWLTGPRRHPCAAHCSGWRHFMHAIEVILWHELAIMATAALIVAITWGAPNQTGTLAFLVLWGMRASAKLNLFFGVRNLGEEFLPARMRYLAGFFRRRPMNALFPFSVTIPTALAALMIEAAMVPGVTEAESIAHTLVAALLGLAILEHWMMVLPVRLTPLWEWAIRGTRVPAAAMAVTAPGSAATIDLPALAHETLDARTPPERWEPRR